MQVDSIIRTLIDHSGMSDRAMSKAMGKVDSWARQTAAAGRVPKLDTVADVADVAGCDVAIIDRATGETVCVIEPPRRGE